MKETTCNSYDRVVGRRAVGISWVLVLQAIGLLMEGPLLAAQAPSPREIREIASGWRFQVDAHDVGESERWYDAGFDRSSWRGPVARGVGPPRRGDAGL